MKIAVVGPSPVPFVVGGVEKFLWGLCQAINEHTSHQCELVKVPSDESSFFRTLRSYWRFFRLDLEHFDMVIVTKYPAWMVRHPMKVCYMQHRLRGLYDTYCGPFGRGAWLKRVPWAMAGPVMRWAVRWLDDWALSPSRVAAYFCISLTVARRKGYFPEGVLLDAILHPPSPDRFETGGYRYGFTVSRLDPPKRIDLLIEAWRRVEADLELRIAGTGPQEAELKRLAAGDSRVRFLGGLTDDELRRVYADALFVGYVPDKEDYGLITVEAMKSGKPVLTCLDSGGPNELVTHGETGFSVAPDAARLGEKIDLWANRPELARSMGSKARKRVESIRWKNCLDKMHRSFYFCLDEEWTSEQRCRKLVLVLSTYRISPPRQGGQCRIFHLYKELARRYRVVVLSFTEFGEPFDKEELAPGFWEVRVPIAPHHCREIVKAEEVVGESIRDVTMPWFGVLTPLYRGVARIYARSASIVILSHPYLVGMLPRLRSHQLLVYEAHNVEARLKRYLAGSRLGRRLVAAVRQVERRAARRSGLVLATSEEDAAELRHRYRLGRRPMAVVPNGVEVENRLPRDPETLHHAKAELGWDSQRPVALFLGSWHYPNLEAVRSLQSIAVALPEVAFEVLGDVRRLFELKDDLASLPPNLRLHGMVSEELKHQIFAASDLALNPMSSGGGTNLKMLDYMASGLPTLSTEVGARGLGIVSGVHGIVEPLSRWPELITGLLEDRGRLQELGREGRELCRARFDWRALGASAFEILERQSMAPLPQTVRFGPFISWKARVQMAVHRIANALGRRRQGGKELPRLGGGWHVPEKWLHDSGGKRCFHARWTRGCATASLPNPKRPAHLLLELFPGPKIRSIEVTVGEKFHRTLSLSEDWNSMILELPEILGTEWLAVRLDSETWVPDELSGGGDLRRLGVAVRRVELRETS